MLQPATLPAGHRLGGRYEILRVLGVGGSAVVYAARDTRIGDELALKVLRPEKSSDLLIRRSRREAGIARGLSHPRLVRVFEWQELDDAVCLPMELVSGGSLRDLLRAGPLSIDRAIELATEILEALAVLHAHEVVHRDVKPANLLMTPDGHVKLSDFGIARRWTRDESALTRGDLPLGTVDYLSPEQAAGKTAEARSDLYSFGIVLYEMLTGSLPFTRDSALGAVVARLQEPAPDVRTIRADVPAWLASIVARLLDRDVEQRYRSANDALDDLQKRRATAPRRSRKVTLIFAIFALILAAGAWKMLSSRKLPTLVADGGWGVKALDDDGRVLWSRRDVNYPRRTALVRRGAQKPEYAAILNEDQTRTDASLQMLSFLDPRTGKVLRQVRLPSGAPTFATFSQRFGVHQVVAHDIDGDGFDEVFASYNHALYWPSFIVMHDPKNGASRILIIASGHHHIAAAHDFDGDGRKELLLSGVNNKMGWHLALAVLRVERSDPGSDLTASTPDAIYTRPVRQSLLWYALAPPGTAPSSDEVEIDDARRRIRLNYVTSAPFEIGFDGFTDARAINAVDRNRARDEAYAHLRESVRLSSTAFPVDAAAAAEKARAIASNIGDDMLATWADRLRGKALVEAGRTTEATAIFDRLANRKEISGDLAFDAARSLHLAGEVEQAIAWYRRGLGPEARMSVGRLRWEFLEGLVLALVELDRSGEALREAAQFDDAYPIETGIGEWCARYVQWRRGAAPEPIPVHENSHDLHRYWALEMRVRRGDDLAQLLATIPDERHRTSSSAALLRSVESEILWRLGRRDEARRAAGEALERATLDRSKETEVRAHFDLIRERYETMR